RRRPVAPIAIDIGEASPPRCPNTGPPSDATDGVSVAVGFLNSGASDAVVRYLPSGPLPYLLLPSAVNRYGGLPIEAVAVSGLPSPSTSATTGAASAPGPTSGSSSVWGMAVGTGQPFT